MGVLEGNVEVGQHQPLGHQRHQLAHMGVGVDIVEPHPSAQAAQLAGEIGDMGAHLAALPRREVMLAVHAIGRGVLRDHQKLPHPRIHQLFRFAQDGMGRAAGQFAAHVGDDAEFAGMVAAFGNLQIAVMPGGQFDPGGGHQVDERIGRRRHSLVHGVQDRLVLMGARHGQNLGMRAGDVLGFGTKAARHQHLAVFAQGLANRLKAFGLCAVQKAAGVDDHRIRTLVIGANRVALGAQARQDAFTVHQRLGAAQGHHANGRLARAAVGVKHRFRGKIRAEVRGVLAHARCYSANWRGGKGARLPVAARPEAPRLAPISGSGAIWRPIQEDAAP